MSRVVRRSFMILVSILAMSQPGLGFIFWEVVYHIHLLNRLTSNAEPLIVHVKSKDNDLQEQAVPQNADFHFQFKPSFWGNTLFYCIFKHGGEVKRFDIYKSGDYKLEKLSCRRHRQRPVYWKVEDDGFYRSCDDHEQSYVKLHDW